VGKGGERFALDAVPTPDYLSAR